MIFIVAALKLLPVESFLLDISTIPPCAPRYDLSNRRVIITLANVEAENLRRLLRLDAIVLVVQHFVKLHQELLIHCMLEVRHLDGLRVENHSIAAWNGDVEELEELDDLLVGRLYLLLEQNEDKLVHFAYHLVDWRLCKMLERLQRRLVDAIGGLVFSLVPLGSSIEGRFVLVAVTVTMSVHTEASLLSRMAMSTTLGSLLLLFLRL